MEISNKKACIGGENCLCLQGFFGSNCDQPIKPADCSGHGKLNPIMKCECDKGWHGKTCDCNINCLNGGICSKNKCLCTSEFTGKLCD